MSGDAFNKKYSRKDFLKVGAVALAACYLHSCNLIKKNKIIPVRFAGANSKTGHLLRENKFPEPTAKINIDTVIIGGGVAGLSAARQLKENGFNDFILLELDTATGGNAKGGKNKVSEYPYGAHYLPVPNEKFTDLIDFLKAHNIITGFDEKGLPVYNEYYLCAEPQERLYYKGVWQEGLPPKNGMTEEEHKELERFTALTETYKNATGSDHKPAFTIPAEWSSEDENFLKLDRLSMFEFLKEQQFKTDFIFWFVNYCCKDDFGCDIKTTSAWAGMHYFCSRNGKASNAHAHEQLTWPEGNYFLVNCLKEKISAHLKTGQLVYRISKQEDSWQCFVYDVAQNKSSMYACKHVIAATPQFVNKRLFNLPENIQYTEFNYYPWLVANITINDKKKLNGLGELAWDNVFYHSKSLGYVNACHQTQDRLQNKTVITFYYNFSEQAAKQEREFVYGKDENFWRTFILDDLKTAHPELEEAVDEMELYLYGHGMICPAVGFRSSSSRKQLETGFDNLHFVNSDVSGISIFEQAFYKGTLAAKKILEKHEHKI